jgi:hypothetical protein
MIVRTCRIDGNQRYTAESRSCDLGQRQLSSDIVPTENSGLSAGHRISARSCWRIPALSRRHSERRVAQVEAAPQPGAQLPLDMRLTGERGDEKRLQDWITNVPSVWILADYCLNPSADVAVMRSAEDWA